MLHSWTERRFIDARSRLKELTASTVLQGFNSSSFGQLSPREALVLHMVRRQKRLVNILRGKVVSGRKLETLRTLCGKSVNKRFASWSQESGRFAGERSKLLG